MTTYKPTNESFINIDKDIVEEAVEKGLLEEIGYHVSSKGNENRYYSILGSNDCLMQVQNDLYCIINRTVYCEVDGKSIDIIQELIKYSWYANSTCGSRYHVVAGSTQALRKDGHTARIYLSRVLIALELYGYNKYLDSSYDVHHKGDCYDNRNDMIMYIPRSMHKHRNNHMGGYRIRTVNEFDYIIYRLRNSYAKLAMVTTVA